MKINFSQKQILKIYDDALQVLFPENKIIDLPDDQILNIINVLMVVREAIKKISKNDVD